MIKEQFNLWQMNYDKFYLFITLLALGIFSKISASGSFNKTNIRLNQDYALFFAVNDYLHMDDLQNPIHNANEIAVELRENFGFRVEVVENPNIDDIDRKLNEYEHKFNNGTFNQKGQLFIYFSGHGLSTESNGYFMTRDAAPARPQRTAMEYDFYRDKINGFACQHIMVAIDACHSATFDPSFGNRSDRNYGRPGEQNFDRVLANYESYRSRVFWTSDAKGNETPDRSSFALKLLEGLRGHQNSNKYLRSKELYTLYLEQAAPRPGGGSFGSDEANSCFLFFKKSRVETRNMEDDLSAYRAAVQANTMAAYQQYLRKYPNGDFIFSVQRKIEILETKEQEYLAWQKAKNSNTPQAYSNFIYQYPASIYRSEVERRKQALIDLNNSQPHEEKQQGATNITSDGLILIEGGTFLMGCQNGRDGNCSYRHKPNRLVTVSTFYLSKYEVTQAQWREIMGTDPPELYNRGCDQCPVEGVSWNDVQEFITQLNSQTGLTYRLPTEAEWEYAARGGNRSEGYKYSGGNNIETVAWYVSNSRSDNKHGSQQTTRPVGGKESNELGLHDMTGNVREWCSDWYDKDYYEDSQSNNARGPSSGYERVLRGGSWLDEPEACRVDYRFSIKPAFLDLYLGFRLARTPQ